MAKFSQQAPLYFFTRWQKSSFSLIYEICPSDAPALVGEPLIKVIGESANGPSASQALFTPPSPSPPLESKNLMDGSGDHPPELPHALLRLQNSGDHLQVVSSTSWNVRGNSVRIRNELCFLC